MKILFEQLDVLDNLFIQFGLQPKTQASFEDPKDKDKWIAIKKLIEWFEKRTGWKSNIIEFPAEEFIIYGVQREGDKPNKKIFEDKISEDPFSFAIISLGNRGFNYAKLEERPQFR